MTLPKLRFALLTVGILLGCSAAEASPVTWTLNGVTFADGGTANGLFVYDATSNTISAWSIMVAGGDTVLFSPFTYSPSNSTAQHINAFNGIFILSPGSRIFQLGFTGALTDSGGTLAIVPIYSVEESFGVDFTNFRDLASGSVVGTAAVPEPASLLLLAGGLVGAGLKLSRRFRHHHRAGR